MSSRTLRPLALAALLGASLLLLPACDSGGGGGGSFPEPPGRPSMQLPSQTVTAPARPDTAVARHPRPRVPAAPSPR